MSILAGLPEEVTRRRILRTADTAAFIGVSISTLRRMKDTMTIPAPIKLSDRRIGWQIGDLTAWLDCREAGREWKDCRGAEPAPGPDMRR